MSEREFRLAGHKRRCLETIAKLSTKPVISPVYNYKAMTNHGQTAPEKSLLIWQWKNVRNHRMMGKVILLYASDGQKPRYRLMAGVLTNRSSLIRSFRYMKMLNLGVDRLTNIGRVFWATDSMNRCLS